MTEPKDVGNVVAGCLLATGGLIVYALTLVFARAVVLTALWSWFLLPMGAPAISYATALGLSLTLTAFQPQSEAPAAKDKSLLMILVQPVCKLAALLLVGWIIHKFGWWLLPTRAFTL